MKKTKQKSLFSMHIEENPKAHELSVALNMVGLRSVDIPTADLIIQALDALEKMGGDFDLKTAVSISVNHEKKWHDLNEKYENQKDDGND